MLASLLIRCLWSHKHQGESAPCTIVVIGLSTFLFWGYTCPLLLTKMPQCFLIICIRSALCSYFYWDTMHFHLIDIVTDLHPCQYSFQCISSKKKGPTSMSCEKWISSCKHRLFTDIGEEKGSAFDLFRPITVYFCEICTKIPWHHILALNHGAPLTDRD